MLFPVAEVTRLLSNLIKYPFVNMNNKEAFVVNYEKNAGNQFVSLEKSSKVLIRPADEVEAERARAEKSVFHAMEETAANGEFEPGVPVMNFDEMFRQKKEEAEQLAEQILAGARERAEAIVAEAGKEAEQVIQSAREEGVRQGREEGLVRAEEELAGLRQELEETRKAQEKEYQNLLAEVEPRYVEILCSLIQKVTGVLLSDKKDILLHLIRSSMADIEPSKHYTIRVSAEDVMAVESHREEILAKIGVDAALEVQEEKGLQRDECIIETDNQMVDCGFQTQLDNLVSTLRMLAQ